ncbi:MAG TPA: putative porin [Solimonas sp.]|nr:putative porin [Solimonas sp.]
MPPTFRRRRGLIESALAAGLTAAAALAPGAVALAQADSAAPTQPAAARMAAAKINMHLRARAATDSPSLTVVMKDGEVEILGEDGEFAQVRLSSGKTGYLKSKHLRPLAAKNPAAVLDRPADSAIIAELIGLLADRYALSQDDAQRLIAKLKEAAPAAPAPAPAPEPAAAEPKGRVRVVYLPESEKNRIRQELKEEVIAQAEEENWAKPNALPGWVRKLQIDGDVRLRQEFDFFDEDNSNLFVNYQAINAGAPVNVDPATATLGAIPTLNSTEDRQLLRMRARLGVLANVSDEVTAGLRFATGNTTNPVSTNQTLGGDFNKLSFTVDRVYLNYRPTPKQSYWGGRMANPWLSTELVWDDDLSFDGLAGQLHANWSEQVRLHVTTGAFSVGNTDFNFPSSSVNKAGSRDKWLLGLQLGADWRIDERQLLKGALALYVFDNLEGELSTPCFAPNSAVSCSSDHTRPGFLQKGNTLYKLRNVSRGAGDPEFQYFGLASPFRVLDLTASYDRRLKDALHLMVDADIAWNLGYDRDRVLSKGPDNNYGACPDTDPLCDPPVETGGFAFLLQGKVGHPSIAEAGQWNALAGYRRIESDAVPDAFTDSDFHLGGTNAKGYYVGGAWGLAHNTWLNLRWISTTEASGAPYAIDTLQLDFGARF